MFAPMQSNETEVIMNNSDVATIHKIMLPLRISPELYKKMCAKVYQKKDKQRGYSINQYLTELIAKDLDDKK